MVTFVKKRLLVSTISGLAAILITAGLVYAAWSASGTGNGGAAATVAQGLTVTAITPSGAAANLYPGGPAGTVYFTVANPNPYAVTITSITWGTPTSGNPTACANSNISLAPGAPTSVSISIPANGTSATIGVPGVLDLLHSAPDGCQGQSFNVPMTITGTQQ